MKNDYKCPKCDFKFRGYGYEMHSTIKSHIREKHPEIAEQMNSLLEKVEDIVNEYNIWEWWHW